MEKFFLQEKLQALLLEQKKGLDPYRAAELLGMTGQLEEFLTMTRQLVQDGKILLSKQGKLLSPLACGYRKGKVISQSLRFCFVRPADGGEDIYVGKREQGDAMLGDTVLLSHIEDSDRGCSAKVAKILERGSRLFTGTVRREGREFFLETDAAFRFPLPILFEPNRKGKKPRGSSNIILRDGKKILAEVFPDPKKGKYFALPRKEYGNSSSAKVCADAIIDANGITVPFSPQTLPEAAFQRSRKIPPE